jgi:hypothetical protein
LRYSQTSRPPFQLISHHKTPLAFEIHKKKFQVTSQQIVIVVTTPAGLEIF